MAVPEVIVICIDNSSWMKSHSPKFQAQCDAIKIYCQAKFEAHPETVVGLYTMSSAKFCHLLHPPTRSLEEIVDAFKFIDPGLGELNLVLALSFGRLPFAELVGCLDKNLRMLFLIGGLTNLSRKYVEVYGKAFKDTGIAVDVVNFYLGEPPTHFESEYQYGRRELDAFVNACNRNDNSHIVHVEPKSCNRDVLSMSILKKTLYLSREKNVNVKGETEVSGKNEKAAADDESWEIEYGKHVTHSKGKVEVKNQAAADDKARGIEYGKRVTSRRG